MRLFSLGPGRGVKQKPCRCCQVTGIGVCDHAHVRTQPRHPVASGAQSLPPCAAACFDCRVASCCNKHTDPQLLAVLTGSQLSIQYPVSKVTLRGTGPAGAETSNAQVESVRHAGLEARRGAHREALQVSLTLPASQIAWPTHSRLTARRRLQHGLQSCMLLSKCVFWWPGRL